MAHKWPAFIYEQMDEFYVHWTGPLRGFQKKYTIGVLWNAAAKSMPYAYLIDLACGRGEVKISIAFRTSSTMGENRRNPVSACSIL